MHEKITPDHKNVAFINFSGDEATLVEAITKLVGLDQEKVVFINDGDSIVSQLEELDANEKKPELLVLDLDLSKFSNKQILADIRGHSSFSQIPIIIFTATLDPFSIDPSLKEVQVLRKPYSVAKFSDLLKEYLS